MIVQAMGIPRRRTVTKLLIVCLGLVAFGIYVSISYKPRVRAVDNARERRERDQIQPKLYKLSEKEVLLMKSMESQKHTELLQRESDSTEKDSPTDKEQFVARKERLKEACKARFGQKLSRPRFVYNRLRTESIEFCSLAKTGSTFWKRILYYLDKGLSGPLMSHEFGDIHGKTQRMIIRNESEKGEDELSRIVFVREPYSRLFSAYVDKLFTPRQQNWKQYARPAMRFSRPFASHTELHCSHNVTFPEFVHFFIHSELDNHHPTVDRNEHFVPVSHQCGFCTERMQYDYIGHQEHFAQDTLGILHSVNITTRGRSVGKDFLTFADFDREYARYEMDALIRYTFEHQLDDISQPGPTFCMSRNEALRRLWKALQIRGTLSWHRFFPFAPSDTQDITKEQFLNIAMKAFNASLSDPQISSQPMSSLHEAYSSVPKIDRFLLRKIFQDDFAFFGYESDHPLVFPRDEEFSLPNYYRYFDVFDEFLFSSIG